MALEEAIYGRLAAVSGVTDIVSTRIYPSLLPQGATLPAVTYRRVSGVPERAMGSDAGVARVRMEVDAWASSYSGVKALRDAVVAALKRFTGTVSGETIDATYQLNELDRYEDDLKIHRVMMDFEVWHREDL